MSKLIIIEGTDGSGKQTQTEKLYKRLLNNNIKVEKISFPDYDSKGSALVKMYLNGDFGKDPKSVNAYIASSFYAVDRYASFKTKWEEKYLNDYIIISDRYTGSSMIHQASKIESECEKNKYLKWLKDFEFNKLNLPKPDLTIFLNMPINYSKELIKNRNNKITGNYKKDIHESDDRYMEKAYNFSLKLAEEENWIIIDCISNNEMKSIEEIHEEIFLKVKELL